MLQCSFVAKLSRWIVRCDQSRRPRAQTLTRIQTWSNVSLRGPSRRRLKPRLRLQSGSSSLSFSSSVALAAQSGAPGPRLPDPAVSLTPNSATFPSFVPSFSSLSWGGESGEVRCHSALSLHPFLLLLCGLSHLTGSCAD